ncbi:hypothetical protein K435DRAFT_848901 [Dendrothele bispora CBS 962.96]|uniref:Uncharacterized protein n=1 Tax=Dendrothele bispora (strain CBS 962.96) TaxID=1314807 RepID=A0A4S8MUU0_DENBC|nr:hypothetical protein K435DRAFT_848901 [Dendrothele bispora CBS 962.96]
MTIILLGRAGGGGGAVTKDPCSLSPTVWTAVHGHPQLPPRPIWPTLLSLWQYDSPRRRRGSYSPREGQGDAAQDGFGDGTAQGGIETAQGYIKMTAAQGGIKVAAAQGVMTAVLYIGTNPTIMASNALPISWGASFLESTLTTFTTTIISLDRTS